MVYQTNKKVNIMAKKQALFRISTRIDARVVENLKKKDFYTSSEKPEILNILMRSKGGDLGDAANIVTLLSELKDLGVKIITKSYDFISSAALPVFACGDIRIAQKASDEFFFHRAEPENNSEITKEQILEGEKESFKFMAERFNLPIKTIFDFSDEKARICALDAKELGIVNEILN